MLQIGQWLINFYESSVFAYGAILLLIYTMLAIFSFISIRKYLRRESCSDYHDLLKSALSPGISVIAPAFNEGLSIIMNVQSLLTLNYPIFEVLLINDGSTDNSMEQLIKVFELEKVDFAYNPKLHAKPIRGIYKSTNPAFSKLTVIDKINGKSKADAVNAGINVASFDYFVCTDVDCILEMDTLLKLIKPVMEESSRRIIAVGATLRTANSCDIDQGVIIQMKPPSKLLPKFQEMEYIRAFVLGKMGWNLINCIPNVSGGLGLFDKEIAIKAGGYDAQSFGEDMELLVRMCRYSGDNQIKYAVKYIPETLCWTEVPSTIKIFMRQRSRWARGLAQLMYAHFKMFFNPQYGRAGLITFPYNFFFELLAPIIEIVGLIYYLFLWISGRINTEYAVLLLLFVYSYSIMITTIAILWDQITFRYYKSWKDVLLLCATACLEIFLYHPMIVFFSIRGYYYFLTGKKHVWGDMQRQGFGQARKN